MRRPRAGSVVLAGFVALTGAACSRPGEADDSAKQSEEDLPTPVVVGTVKHGAIAATIRASSTIEAERQVTVHAESTGRIVKLAAEEGDTIRKGQLLARIKYDAQAALLDRANTSLDKATADLETVRTLHARGVASDEELRATELAFAQASLDLRDRRREMNNTQVVAPFSGTVTERFVSEGAFVTAGAQLVSVTDFETLVAVVYVPESELDRIAVGQAAKIAGKTGDLRVGTGSVKRIAPIIDAATGTVKVTIALPPPVAEGGMQRGFLPGMYAEVEMTTQEHPNAILVPKEAVLFDDAEAYVFVVSGDKAQRRSVVLSLDDGQRVEVQQGLQAGEEVVLAGHAGLKDGATVRRVDPLGQPVESEDGSAEEVAHRSTPVPGEGA